MYETCADIIINVNLKKKKYSRQRERELFLQDIWSGKPLPFISLNDILPDQIFQHASDRSSDGLSGNKYCNSRTGDR